MPVIVGIFILISKENFRLSWVEQKSFITSCDRQSLFQRGSWLPIFERLCGLSDEVKDVLWSAACCDCQDPSIRSSDPMWRLEWPCRPCRHWIQGSAWWDGVWQAWPRCRLWENPRVCPSIWPASWEHMFRETWQPSHHIQVGKHSHADRLHPFP